LSKKTTTTNNQKPTSSKGDASKGKATSVAISHKMIADNRKARHRFEVLESIECGVMLHGSEVKSLRDGKCSIEEAYGRIKNNELWLVGCDIGEYKPATFWNHEPTRARKLLLHKRELLRLTAKASDKGLTIVPLKMYFNDRGLAKLSVGLCRGLKMHDKREVLKKKEARREIDRMMKRKM
jgi:SsrA-binding protein